MFFNCFQTEETKAEVWKGCDKVQLAGGTNPGASGNIVRIWGSFLCDTKSTWGGRFLIFCLSRRRTSSVSIWGIYRIRPFISTLTSTLSTSTTSSNSPTSTSCPLALLRSSGTGCDVDWSRRGNLGSFGLIRGPRAFSMVFYLQNLLVIYCLMTVTVTPTSASKYWRVYFFSLVDQYRHQNIAWVTSAGRFVLSHFMRVNGDSTFLKTHLAVQGPFDAFIAGTMSFISW